MADNERLLESHLRRLESGCESDASSGSPAHPEIAPDISLIMALRAVEPPAREVDAARLRVRARVFDAIVTDEDAVDAASAARHRQPLRRSPAVLGNPRVVKGRLLTAVAAIFLLALLGSWALSSAASAATPSSPLYGLKRADEWLALHSAWSDQRRGQVYATIAWHRLAEAQFESQRHNDGAAQRLTLEYSDTMQRLIQLDANMETRHENTTVVAQGIARNLDRAYTVAQAASRSGQSTLAQTLTATTTAEQEAIQQANITLPNTGGHVPTGQPGATPPSHGRTPTPSTGAIQTPTVGQATITPTPGNGNGNGNNGGGNGNGSGGNGSGNGDHGR